MKPVLFGTLMFLLAQAAAAGTEAPRALSTSRPVLSATPSSEHAYARVELRGFGADGALAYLTWAQENDSLVCDASGYEWTAKVLTLQRGQRVELYRFEASGDPPVGPLGKIADTVAAARKAHQCETKRVDADEYDRAPNGGKAALAALGKLTPVCDLQKQKCRAPDGRGVTLTIHNAKIPGEKNPACRDARVSLSIGGRSIFEEHKRDCSDMRAVVASISFSKDSHLAAVAWTVSTQAVRDGDLDEFGRLDVLPVP